MSLHTSYHADSDADDEYERSVITSPHLATDSEASPSESEFPSAEHTPTTLANVDDNPRSPRTIITEWTAEECANFVAALGLRQYCAAFLGKSPRYQNKGAKAFGSLTAWCLYYNRKRNRWRSAHRPET